MVANNDPVTINFVHPTDSTRVLTATVGATSTPQYLIGELVKSKFMPKAAGGAQYKLLNADKELGDHETLQAAGVATNTTLNVMHSVSGAGQEGGDR